VIVKSHRVCSIIFRRSIWQIDANELSKRNEKRMIASVRMAIYRGKSLICWKLRFKHYNAQVVEILVGVKTMNEDHRSEYACV
jgi:hypothetical protein